MNIKTEIEDLVNNLVFPENFLIQIIDNRL